jgi:hypothetical protein
LSPCLRGDRPNEGGDVLSPCLRGDRPNEVTPRGECVRREFGVRFRRQHPIGPYIVDFACVALKLAVELDGSQHFENPADPTWWFAPSPRWSKSCSRANG